MENESTVFGVAEMNRDTPDIILLRTYEWWKEGGMASSNRGKKTIIF